MAKTQGELNALKIDLKDLNNKLSELSDEELKAVTGGVKYNLNVQILSAFPLFGALLGTDVRPSSTTNTAETMSMEALNDKANPASNNR